MIRRQVFCGVFGAIPRAATAFFPFARGLAGGENGGAGVVTEKIEVRPTPALCHIGKGFFPAASSSSVVSEIGLANRPQQS